MKKFLALSLVLVMALTLLAGCGSQVGDANAGQKIKVALIMEGSTADMSWNATAYNGLKKIEALGAEIGYVENIAASDGADAIRTFAGEGYNVIFMSSNSYMDVASATAPEFPNVQFFLINSTIMTDNVMSLRIADAEQGFLMGALGALLTKTGKIGFVGGMEITPLINGSKGFEQGAKYVNPDIEVIINFTGDSNDVAAAKELGLSMAQAGADVLSPMANQAALGCMEAAEEAGIKAIASGLNMETVAPNAAVVTIVKDTSIAYEAAYKAYLEKTLPNDILYMGVDYGVVYVGDYYIEIDQSVKDSLAEIQEKLSKHEITINLS